LKGTDCIVQRNIFCHCGCGEQKIRSLPSRTNVSRVGRACSEGINQVSNTRWAQRDSSQFLVRAISIFGRMSLSWIPRATLALSELPSLRRKNLGRCQKVHRAPLSATKNTCRNRHLNDRCLNSNRLISSTSHFFTH
jgi:hypothetical protein